MALPNPGMDFTAFDILPASDLDKMVANIESLANGTGSDNGSVTGAKISSGATGVGNANLLTTAGDIGGAWLATTASATGFASKTLDSFRYTKIGNTVIGYVAISGASNATSLTFTLPVAAASNVIMIDFQADNNSVRVVTPAKITVTSTTATCFINPSDTLWIASNNKAISGMLIYFTD